MDFCSDVDTRESLADEDDADDEDTDDGDETADHSSDDDDAGDIDELLDEALDKDHEEHNEHTNDKPSVKKDSAAAAEPVSLLMHRFWINNMPLYS